MGQCQDLSIDIDLVALYLTWLLDFFFFSGLSSFLIIAHQSSALPPGFLPEKGLTYYLPLRKEKKIR